MLEVRFHDFAEDELLRFAVIVSRSKKQWVFCKHKQRDTYECPGGHREVNETIEDTARRELYEETGAVQFKLLPVCTYSVIYEEEETYGMLYFADIEEFGELPPLEIERVELFDQLPTHWTYPLIQPVLLDKVREFIAE